MLQRILIFRLSAIGDSILSVPVLNAVRKQYPKARIGWVIEPASAQLIEGHAALDDLIVVPKQTFRSVSGLLRLRCQLRDWNPDVTLDLQGLTKSSALAWLSGAKTRFGLVRDEFDGRELSTRFNNRLYRPKAQHIVERQLELLSQLGIEGNAIEFDMPQRDEDAQFADRLLQTLQLDSRFAVINVGAGWPSKIWPAERYAAVARHLGEHWGTPSLVVWAGPAEQAAAEQVVEQSNGQALLAPNTTLRQLGSIIRRAALFVGSDTGPMHLSVALQTPTVAMIGPMPLERVGPLGPQHIGLQRQRLAPHANRKEDCRPMLSITQEDVMTACDRLMDRAWKARAS